MRVVVQHRSATTIRDRLLLGSQLIRLRPADVSAAAAMTSVLELKCEAPERPAERGLASGRTEVQHDP